MNTTPQEDKSPLEFFAAYLPGEGTKRHYLGNGKTGKQKGIRLFKSEQGARDHLDELLDKGIITQEAYDHIVIHPVEGKLALPAPEEYSKQINLGNIPRLKVPDHLKPITTLHKPTAPTAIELLEDFQRKKKRRRN